MLLISDIKKKSYLQGWSQRMCFFLNVKESIFYQNLNFLLIYRSSSLRVTALCFYISGD